MVRLQPDTWLWLHRRPSRPNPVELPGNRLRTQHRRHHHHHHQHQFDETPQRDPSRLNALLATYVHANNTESALLLFHRMHREGLRLDGYSFTPVLTACPALPGGGLLLGRQVHALAIKTGSLSGPVVGTALLNMYSKCDGGHPSDAVSVFDEMRSPTRDAVAWNALLSCFVRHSRAADAISAFRFMTTTDERIRFTSFTLCTVLKACGSLKALRQGEQVHALVVVTGVGHNSIVLGTALVDFYSDCGLVPGAVKVFDNLGCQKDDAIYNALISGCVRNKRYDEAFSITGKMKLTATALTSALSACSESTNLPYGKQIHCAVLRRGFDSDAVLCNALLGAYAKCGDIAAAHSVFDRIGEKSVVSWTSIIDAYGSQGRGIEALMLFREMEEGGGGSGRRVPPPNAVTFLSVLSACGHSGLVEEGRDCFRSMRGRHGLRPGAEHYACFIDLLGRAGRIEEAWEIFLGMGASGGAEPTAAVCVAMLNACRVGMDAARGEYVARRLLELEPENSGCCVLLSNFYAAFGRWEGVEELRRVMKDRGLRKQAGSSWVGCF